MEPVQLAAILAAVVVLASILSVELGIAVALFELGLGVVVGNAFDLQSQQWLDFIATFASIVLTFLAGLEVDPTYFRQRFAASVSIGLVSFIGPFVVASLVAYGLLDWTVKASLIAGTALSTTSLAVIYAVLVEDGLNQTALGKLLMSATFVTDMATAVALSAIFIKPNVWFPVFLIVSVGDDVRVAEDRQALLRPLRKPRDRAGDQAHLRLPLGADGLGGCVQRPRRASRLHPGVGDEPPLPGAPK